MLLPHRQWSESTAGGSDRFSNGNPNLFNSICSPKQPNPEAAVARKALSLSASLSRPRERFVEQKQHQHQQQQKQKQTEKGDTEHNTTEGGMNTYIVHANARTRGRVDTLPPSTTMVTTTPCRRCL